MPPTPQLDHPARPAACSLAAQLRAEAVRHLFGPLACASGCSNVFDSIATPCSRRTPSVRAKASESETDRRGDGCAGLWRPGGGARGTTRRCRGHCRPRFGGARRHPSHTVTVPGRAAGALWAGPSSCAESTGRRQCRGGFLRPSEARGEPVPRPGSPGGGFRVGVLRCRGAAMGGPGSDPRPPSAAVRVADPVPAAARGSARALSLPVGGGGRMASAPAS